MNILGISAFYHDSAACLLRDGEIVAAAQEERFTRKKHDDRFPSNAVRYCLAEAGLSGNDLHGVAFYDKPITKFTRILESFMAVAPRGVKPFMAALPLWIRKKLHTPLEIETSLAACGVAMPAHLYFPEHHQSHAASAFYPSPFENAAVLTVDGVGEWATTTIGHGRGRELTLLKELRFPHSLGLLYSAFTHFTGFRVNSGEYKLMGLAPYGNPTYVQAIYDHLLDLKDDGSFRLNMDYFGYLTDVRMTNDRFARLFGGPARPPESDITRREMDLARSIQAVTEDIVLKLARHARELTGEKHLCLAGGVALNCVANGRLLAEGIFEDIWIQPAAGDAGGALGAALMAWHMGEQQPRHTTPGQDSMKGSYLGPAFSDEEIGEWLQARGYPAHSCSDEQWPTAVARLLADQKVVGLVNGRMEFGPRALGGRSILGDARSPSMQSVMNLKIKHRESFRPFAPSCPVENVSDFFDLDRPSPYMLLVRPVRADRLLPVQAPDTTDMRQIINQARSDIPAVTHVDNSARIQTVHPRDNPRFHRLLQAFGDLTGSPILINTSFNVRGEPIVCTPEDAYRCFMRTEMDALVLGSWILHKPEQPPLPDSDDWKTTFTLD